MSNTLFFVSDREAAKRESLLLSSISQEAEEIASNVADTQRSMLIKIKIRPPRNNANLGKDYTAAATKML